MENTQLQNLFSWIVLQLTVLHFTMNDFTSLEKFDMSIGFLVLKFEVQIVDHLQSCTNLVLLLLEIYWRLKMQ